MLCFTVEFDVCIDVELPAVVSTDVEVLRALVAGRRAAPSVEDARRDGTLLLIVDDHPINRRVLVGQAASLGYASEAAEDGLQALQAWKTGRFGAVITDCNMPRMNGYEFATAVRAWEAEHGSARLPIIGCTANALASAAALCIEAGMDDCVVKPADLGEMSRKLDHWLPLNGGAAADNSNPPRGASRHGAGLLDMGLLQGVSGGDAAVQAEILGEFRRVTALDAVALRHALVNADFPAVVQFAHRIKGSGLMLGATSLAQACAALEEAGAARQGGALAGGAEKFEAELGRLNRHLASILAAAPVND